MQSIDEPIEQHVRESEAGSAPAPHGQTDGAGAVLDTRGV